MILASASTEALVLIKRLQTVLSAPTALAAANCFSPPAQAYHACPAAQPGMKSLQRGTLIASDLFRVPRKTVETFHAD